ncbi:MAG: 3-hydroxyacyl-CoA dehydrogenase NAD-binding domain-containing protein [Salinivenus sp.]
MTTPPSLSTDQLRLDVDTSGVATAWLDAPSTSVNKISQATLDGFSELLDTVSGTDRIRGLVLASGKPDSFVVGADLNMLTSFEMPAEARAVSRQAHRLVSRLRALDVPTVAAIHGPCAGGGLELALGCDYRIASRSSNTHLSLPEVKLGLLPGGGGTQYLPRLIGVQQALTLMLTGKNTYPEKARRLGLVDALIHPPGLHQAAVRAARELADGTRTVDREGPSLGEQVLESNTLSRRIIYRQARKRTAARTRGNYPAPPRIIDAVRTGMEGGLDEGLDAEMRHFGELVFTRESKALVQVFFAKQSGEKNPWAEQARPVETIGVLGAGLMGAGIAQVSAENERRVVLKDQTLDLAAQGKKRVWTAANRETEKGIINRFERDRRVERVVPTGTYGPLQSCDLVIEAVPEDLDLKHEVLSDTEAVIEEEAVYASNTSSLPIAEIASAAERPERVVGMHYFSPVPDIPLLEVVRTEQTSDAALATAVEAGLAQGKTVIVVNDGPGFYTTRILALYMNEALLLLEAGADVSTVDSMMKDFGFPMGPFELFDFVGLDVAGKITDVMRERLPADRLDISDTAARLAEANLLGHKTHDGFYHYKPTADGEDPEREDVNEAIYDVVSPAHQTTPPADIVQDRLGLMMVNEAVRCLDDGILRSPTDGDLGAVFGLGFPPFLGGPFRYVDQEGAGAILERLRDLAERYGDRFRPADRLVTLASENRSFHP